MKIHGQPLVSLRGVSFSYPMPGGGTRPALHGIDFTQHSGESVVVLGANGAGKSTLAALVAGVESATGGEIARAPASGPDTPPVLPVGLVTQNPEDCFSSPVVREEMGVVLENLEREPADIDRAVDAALAEIGLEGHADAHPATLSGGQKQLLAIASVLIADPPLLVLDEPLTLLDAPGRAEVDRLLERRRGPAATLYLTSEVEEAGRGERVVVLHRGGVVWEGPSGDLPRDAAILGGWGLLPPTSPAFLSRECPEAVETENWCGGSGQCRPEAGPGTRWRRGGAEGRSPSADQREHDGGPQRPDPEACTGTSASSFGAPSIIVEDLEFSYDPGTPHERPVLRGLNLVARPGELLGIVGAIGSGKTTLIQHFNGLLPPQRGRVRVGERMLEPGRKPARLLHREVGLVFQFPEKQLFAETVDEDVAAGPEFAGFPEDAIPALVRAALDRVGLDPDEHGPRPPFSLTWGEKRLAAIAGVLVLGTPCLVLDEPGAGLDPRGRRRVMGLLADLAHDEGRTVVVVSHHLDDLFRVADRVAVLYAGRVVFDGPPGALAASGEFFRWGLAVRPAAPPTPRTPPPRS